MDKKECIEFTKELVLSSISLCYIEFDGDLNLVKTNSLEKYKIFKDLLDFYDFEKSIIPFTETHNTPFIFSFTMGLVFWAIIDKIEGELDRVYIWGPAFTSEVSEQVLIKALWGDEVPRIGKILNVLKNLPHISITEIYRYILMLHFSVTGEQISTSDIFFKKIEPRNQEFSDKFNFQELFDRRRVYEYERKLMLKIETGDLDYSDVLERAYNFSSGVKMDTGEPIRQVKDSVIVFTSLCSRAAIVGGLTPEVAYRLGDQYILEIERSKSLSNIGHLSHTMYRDFIQRVHSIKELGTVSKTILSVCNYIKSHIREKISLDDLVEYSGYSKYYLTRKFHREVGCRINHYIMKQKVEEAKLLLELSQDSIEEISDNLGFCSRGYFSESFKKISGFSPAEYRNGNHQEAGRYSLLPASR